MKNLALNVKTMAAILPCLLVATNSTTLEICSAAYAVLLITLAVKTKRGRSILHRLYKQSLEIDNFLANNKTSEG